MITDRQAKRLWTALSSGKTLAQSADKAGMDEKTARKYRRLGRLPSEVAPERDWRTREDPFAEVWPEVHTQLQETPGLQAKTLLAWLQAKYPGKFDDTQLRSFQRGVKRWRATAGPAKEVFFSQVHHPGRLCASDFTHMNSLSVTIGGQPFDHLVYHFVLTYSNWESVTICFSESFESLSEGFQNAVWELGGVPERHRTDRMSLAVNNASSDKEFTERYAGLLGYYGVEMERFPRLRGRKKHAINYRHIIDWLVRKPGAFENYVYREELFPTSRFRMAYDALRQSQPERGHKEYLGILYLAARQSETAVDEALRTLFDSDRAVTRSAVEELVHRAEEVPAVTDVTVEDVDLLDFDDLFLHKEVWDGFQGGCEGAVDDLLAGTALADVSGVF